MPFEEVDITLVVDNQAQDGLASEHGFAMWIEASGRRVLFDTGQGPALAANADKLGIPLEKTETLVLSHGHFDHTGGLSHVLLRNPSVDLFCHPAAVKPRYSIRSGKAEAIHMPREAMAALDRLPEAHMHWTSRPAQISKDVGLTGFIPRESDFEDTGGPFYLDTAARRSDAIDDDMALWIDTPDGLVVCVGCAHAGLVNTLNHIRRLNGGTAIRAVIGGFHLYNASQGRIRRTVSALKALAPEEIIACHCTGDKAMAALENALDGCFKRGYAGMRLRYQI